MKTLIAVLLSFLFVSITNAQVPVAWQKSFALTGQLFEVLCMDQTSDGGYILGGKSNGYLLIRITSEGDTLWTRRYPTSFCTGAIFVHEASDGGFYFAGSTNESIGEWNAHVIKTNSIGSTIWSNTYSPGAAVLAASPTADGGIILAGGAFGDFYLEKLNASGSSVWMERYPGGPHGNALYSVIQTSDGGFFAGGAENPDGYDDKCYILRTDSLGTLLWERTYPEFGPSYVLDVAQASNGDFVFIYNPPSMARINPQGDTLWTRSILEHGQLFKTISYVENAAIVSGRKFVNADAYGYVAKLSSTGTIQWELESDQGGRYNQFNTACLSLGGSIILAGMCIKDTYCHGEVSLLKICREGSNVGRLKSITGRSSWGAYRLYSEAGEVNNLVVTDLGTGATGWVTGTAASSWNAMPNGDGNNGDSVIFVATSGLQADSVGLDTFWISSPDPICSFLWNAGCRTDTLHIWNGVTDSLVFRGENYGFHNEIRIIINVAREWNVNSYEVIGYSANSCSYSILSTFSATNDSGPNEYVYRDLNAGHNRYLLRTSDATGCQYSFIDRELIVGINVPAMNPFILHSSSYTLSAFPNPFNPSTSIAFTLPQTGRARLVVYDIMGREVRVLHEGITETGEHRFTFDGAGLASGIYFTRLESAGVVKTQKLLLLK